jgi:hypothetical protein
MHRRRSFLITLGLMTGLVAAVGGVAVLLFKREPAFYAASVPSEDLEARGKSAQLITRVQELKNDIVTKAEWGDTFTANDLNCFFAANMSRKGGLCALLPEGFHSPRVAVEGDRLKLGFRYRDGFWSTVVWVELKVWLVAKDTNVVAVEVCDLRAGGVPIGSQSILDAITEAARGSNIEVTWYRHKSNPVGLFRFYADQPQPAAQIVTLEVKDGQLTVAGRSLLSQLSALPEQTPPPP